MNNQCKNKTFEILTMYIILYSFCEGLLVGRPQLGHVPKSSRRRSFSISDIILTTFLGIGTLRSYSKPYRQLTVNCPIPLELAKTIASPIKAHISAKNQSIFKKYGRFGKHLKQSFRCDVPRFSIFVHYKVTRDNVNYSFFKKDSKKLHHLSSLISQQKFNRFSKNMSGLESS